MNNAMLPYDYYPNDAQGRPLFNAYIYMGIPDLDPETQANQIDVYGQQEDGTNVLLAQPIRTGAGGVPMYNGSPVVLKIEESFYSLKVLDSNLQQIFYNDNVAASLTASSSSIVLIVPLFDDLSALTGVAGQTVFVNGVAAEGYGAGNFTLKAGSVTTVNGIRRNIGTAGLYAERSNLSYLTPEMLGADGTASGDTTAVTLMISEGFPINLDKWYTINANLPLVSGLTIRGIGEDESGFICDLPGAADPGGFPGNLIRNTSGSRSNILLENFGAVHSATTNIKTCLIDGVNVTNLTVRNIKGAIYRIARVTTSGSRLFFDNLERLPIEARFDDTFEDGGSVISLQGCSRVKINGIEADDVFEVIDLGVASKVKISNVGATSRVGATGNEAFDFGAVSKVTLTNFVISGFASGVFVKEESTTGCYDVTVSNGLIDEFSSIGCRVFSRAQYPSVPSDPVMQRVKISSVICKSSITDSIAFSIGNSGQTSGSYDVELLGCTGDAQFSAIVIRAANNIKIIGGTYKSVSSHVISIDDSSSETASTGNILINGATIDGSSLSGANLAAIRATTSSNINVIDCPEIKTNASYRAIYFTDCKRPKIQGNTFGTCLRAIQLEWTDEAWLIASPNLNIGVIVEGNIAEDWVDYGLYFSSTLTPASPYQGLRVNNNTFTSYPIASKFPIALAIVDQSFGVSAITDNVLVGAVHVVNSSRLVAATSTIRNITNP